MSSFLWTMSIAIFMYLVISKKHTLAVKLIPLFHMVCWGIPLVIVCFSMAFGVLGSTGAVDWCWINSYEHISWPRFSPEDTVIFWKMIAGKGIELIACIFTTVTYIISKRKLDIQLEDYDQRLYLNTNVRATLMDTDRKLVLIPLIFVGVRVWGSVRFLVQPYQDVYWLALVQGVGDSAQGWMNCILFCITTRKIREKFVDSCFCRKKEVESTTVSNSNP